MRHHLVVNRFPKEICKINRTKLASRRNEKTKKYELSGVIPHSIRIRCNHVHSVHVQARREIGSSTTSDLYQSSILSTVLSCFLHMYSSRSSLIQARSRTSPALGHGPAEKCEVPKTSMIPAWLSLQGLLLGFRSRLFVWSDDVDPNLNAGPSLSALGLSVVFCIREFRCKIFSQL